MHCAGRGRVVGFRGGKDGALWLLPSGPDLGGVAGREPSAGRGQPSQPAPGDPRGQWASPAGSRGRVTALTVSPDGIPEDPATLRNPHREETGDNPVSSGGSVPPSPRSLFLSPTLMTPVSPLITSCSREDPAALVLSKRHLRQINTNACKHTECLWKGTQDSILGEETRSCISSLTEQDEKHMMCSVPCSGVLLLRQGGSRRQRVS